jgi:glycosyltransferase involved in cell wall biosynthesis
MSGRFLLSVVAPARDEAEVLPEFHRRLAAALSSMQVDSEIVYVDDGSTDGTWELLSGLATSDVRRRTLQVRAMRLSRSFGHQATLTAGIDRACGDAVITIDTDLQDPPELIPELVAKWREGFMVVHARRTHRISGCSTGRPARCCAGCPSATGTSAAWLCGWGSLKPRCATNGRPGQLAGRSTGCAA